MYEEGARQVSPTSSSRSRSSSPPTRRFTLQRLREVEKLGATIVVAMNNSGADPHGAIEVYGEHVLPALRGARGG